MTAGNLISYAILWALHVAIDKAHTRPGARSGVRNIAWERKRFDAWVMTGHAADDAIGRWLPGFHESAAPWGIS